MMEFCCKTIPCVKAANDFSVREIISCISELEKSSVLPSEVISRWKGYLSSIEPQKCYNQFAKDPTQTINNWALFTAVSEFFRQNMGLCDSTDFIDIQIATQLSRLDENGMYMDNTKSDIHQPIMYDIVPRGLFALLLHFGYRGKYYNEIDECLKKTALMMLNMQSTNGEMAFGGRSNQFLHNEPWCTALYEYEANRYKKEGNDELAALFKSAIARCIKVTEKWLSFYPIRHIKNKFPAGCDYGCENYAYFDKYMITAASNLFCAYLMCDDSIDAEEVADNSSAVFKTSEFFHKFFLKSGGYMLEFDTNADPHYDASGLGRVHKQDAPSTICLSVPCPKSPNYKLDIEDNVALSLCVGVEKEGKLFFALDESVEYEVASSYAKENEAGAELRCDFGKNLYVTAKYTVNHDGVKIEAVGEGRIAFLLPAFHFDGETYTQILCDGNTLTVKYDGWCCRYIASSAIFALDKMAANRNGYYKAFYISAENKIQVKIEIFEI
ncbi:MAG: hypothetical protein E7612_06250 [Ruminococcaceae bacterium]|nr:hypothetical protein [Oscillospiraceae bacterium]